MEIPGLFVVYFQSFSNKPIQLLQQINVKIVHTVYSDGIRTDDLQQD